MQPLVCSRPFASQTQARTAAQHGRVGLAFSTQQLRQARQRPQQQAATLAYSASSSIRGCSCNSFAGALLPASPLLERQISSGDYEICSVLRQPSRQWVFDCSSLRSLHASVCSRLVQ